MGHLLKILVAFLVLCLLEQDAQGAPAKGRYMWVRCRPDVRNANCLKEWGPWISLPRFRDRLPPSAVKGIIKASLDLDLQSTDGSGTSGLLVDSGSGDQSSSDWGSGDQLDWQYLGLFKAEGRVQQVEGSSSEGSGSGGSSSEGSVLGSSSLEGSGLGSSSSEGSGLGSSSSEGSGSGGSSSEGSGLGGSSLEGSGSGGSSSEGSGSVLDYTDFVFPQSVTVQQNVPHTLELQEDNFNV